MALSDKRLGIMPKITQKERIKKWLSSLLIFVIFASQTIQYPFTIPRSLASGSQAPNLVSIIVSESTNRALKNKIKTYANDIQSALTNTRVVIVEVPNAVAPHSIAALNEKFYYEGDGNGISRLVGTVLIGKLPIPVVHKGPKTFLSIYPYTDFDDKVFVYDANKGYYEQSSTPVNRDTPEIWHGVIQPNSGDSAKDQQELSDFLDKTHNYYTKKGIFANSQPDPYVFYLDIAHDQQASKPENWKAYKLYLEYLEDLAYNRFNKHLAKELYDKFQGFQAIDSAVTPAELKALGIDLPDEQNTIDFTSSPDIQTRQAIAKTTKQFFEVFNDKYIGDILKFVYNTGRYGDGSNIRADLAQVQISKRDEFMKRVLKDANTAMEDLIDGVVKNGLSRDIALPLQITEEQDPEIVPKSKKPPLYVNYYYGLSADQVNSAKDCTIVRGKSLAVEANRGYNIKNVQGDVQRLSTEWARCFNGSAKTENLYGGNTPLNMRTTTLSAAEIAKLSTSKDPADFEDYQKKSSVFRLQGNVYQDYVLPTYDLQGQRELDAQSDPRLTVASPADCEVENFIASPYSVELDGEYGKKYFYSPASTQGGSFSCDMVDSDGGSGHKTYDGDASAILNSALAGTLNPEKCSIYNVSIDGGPSMTFGRKCIEEGGDPQFPNVTKSFSFKKIPSWIEHKSPTDEEYGAALKGMTTPSLAVDKDRYIDFIGPSGTIDKIEYPNFFRMKWPDDQNLTADMVSAKIKEVLDAKSAQINSLMGSENPSNLTGNAKKTFDALKHGDYPTQQIDLYAKLTENSQTLPTLVDTILWYNEANATSKYAFILENYLDADGNHGYPLAGHRNDYELGYIGGPGNAANMLVKVDPDSKNPPPKDISDIQTDYSALMNLIDGANIGSYREEDAKFKCGPPEGVPIWEWLPAVFCWLGTVLPPKISIGSCGSALGGLKESGRSHFSAIDANGNGTPDYLEDLNNNGIPDGYEWIENGEIELTSSSKQMGHLSSMPLTATMFVDGNILGQDSYNEVHFDILKVILKKGQTKEDGTVATSDQVVYDKGAVGSLSDLETLQKYVQFSPIGVHAEGGVAEYSIGSKTADVNVSIAASVYPKDKNGEIAFTKLSNVLNLEIRDEALHVEPVTQTAQGDANGTSFEAGKANGIVFKFSISKWDGLYPTLQTTEVQKPISVRILDDIDGTVLVPTRKFNTDTYYFNDSETHLLKEVGNYRFEFTDAKGRIGTVVYNILPAEPTRLDAVAVSSLFVKKQKDTVVVTAKDGYGKDNAGNIAKGIALNFEATVSGGAYFTENNDTKITKTTIEGAVNLEISSNSGGENETVHVELKLSNGKVLKQDISVRSIDYAKIAVKMTDGNGNPLSGANTAIAGGDPKDLKISILDSGNNLLSGFNGYAALDFPKNSGSFTNSFVKIESGTSSGKLQFIPGTVAIRDGKIDVQIPGIKDIDGGNLTVLPNLPMRVELRSDNSNLEAKIGAQTAIQARLYDRYGNLAYNHLEWMRARFTVPEGYGKYGSITPETVAFSNGVASTVLKTTKNPGTLYYKATVIPGLENNSFSVSDPSGASIVIKWLSSNVGVVETYYLWNAEKLRNTNYNVLSTTLLGADYGNLTVPNYLAGELLFSPNSRSLAVTSVLNLATKKNSILTLTPGGKITNSSTTLSRVDVGSSRNHTTLSLYDPFKRENIGQIYLNLSTDTPLFACDTSDADNLDACDNGWKNSYVILKGMGRAVAKKSNVLSLNLDGIPVFEISPDGTIKKYPTVTVEADGTETKNLLSLSIKSNGVSIGRVGMKWNSNRVEVTSPDQVDSSLMNNPGVLVYETASPRYATRLDFLGNSSFGARGLTVFQADDKNTGVDRDLIGASAKTGLEEYANKQGIGFGNGNNTLLEFASQASVGESSRAAATYSEIVLGDPVARLPELKKNGQAFDRTLGKRISDERGGTIESYSTIDYNHDDQEDIVVFYDDGRVELIQNFAGTYKTLGYLLYVVDAGPERKAAGDFNGDGYGDIVMVDNKGKLITIENQDGKFVRVPTRILQEDGKTPATIKGSIMQLETFDMDQDGKMDVVISDDSGELNILYGSNDETGLYFTKKLLDENIGIRLQGESLQSGGAIRWDGIPEIQPVTQTDYARQSEQANATTDGDELSLEDQKRLLDSKIYYLQTVKVRAASEAAAEEKRLLGSIGDDPNHPGTPNTELMEKIRKSIDDAKKLAASWSIDTSTLTDTAIEGTKTYLRSEFADGKNIGIDKKYIDKNGDMLQAGDRVEVTVSITNSGSTALSHVGYLDSNEASVFKPSENKEFGIFNNGTLSATGTLTPLVEGSFDYQFDDLYIPVGQTVTIKYQLVANAIRYGKFKVGILESDDSYGDVSMNANAVCGDREILWKSVLPPPRSYQRFLKDIPKKGDSEGRLNGKFTDFNHNGQPDYIDLLSGSGWQDEIGSTLWNPDKYGVLVFREVPIEGIIDGTSIQIGRVVGDATKDFVQMNSESKTTDVPVLSDPTLDKPTVTGSGILAGSLSGPSGVLCGMPGTVTSDLRLKWYRQDFDRTSADNLKGVFKLSAIGKSNTLDASGKITGTQACYLNMNEVSDPKSDGTKVTGLGWKLLTKSTFSHYGMAGTQADIVNSNRWIPDSEEPNGDSYFTYNANGQFSGQIELSGLSSANVDKINSKIDTIVKGLGCGFWWGSCISSPLNWAPLAPGSAPTVLGFPVGPLTVNTGIPVFSSLTGFIGYCGYSPCCLPTVWPTSPLAYIPGTPACGLPSAGGLLGTWAPTNTFRLFITPTITGAVGMAACFGGPAMASGYIPPPWLSPLIPWGGCIVAAKPLLGCKDDGSDGNISDLGVIDNGNTLNASACRSKNTGNTMTESDRKLIRRYVSGDHSAIRDIFKNAEGRGNFQFPTGPLLSLGGRGGPSDFEVSIDLAAITNFDKGIIQKIQNTRVSGFPDFIMDWVNRQLEEVVNKLTSLPTLYIIKPDFRGALDSGWTGFSDKLSNAYSSGQEKGKAVLGNVQAGRTISGVKAAYEFMSRLPLLKFEKSTVNVSYPTISIEDLNKFINSLKALKAQWTKEIEDKKAIWGDPNNLVLIQAQWLVSSIDANIRIIEDWKKFPEKLAKYLTWKERYASQILCNITAIQNMLDGFITKNALRFKAWVEFGELLKHILEGWQLIPDLFTSYNAECSVCRNERFDLKHFIFKLISGLIPKIPIIKFPKWPDIILDLHNVRLWLRIAMPEFVFTPTPIVLPILPELHLPTIAVNINLPSIPLLPSLPPLPDLPDLPSLPVITLPELPPPPTIPKILGSLKIVLNILKIIAKIMCIMRINPFVPEWRAGDQIAQITERQGKLNLDFLNIEFPQFNVSFVDAIKVTTFVNFEFQVDFLVEMARSAVAPINSFTTNFSNILAKPAGEIPRSIDLRGVIPSNVNVNVGPTSMNDMPDSASLADLPKIPPALHDYAIEMAHAFVATIKAGQFYADQTAEYTDIRANLQDEVAHTVASPGSQEAALLAKISAGLSKRSDAEAEALATTLRSENAEKFKIAKDFINSESQESAELKAQLDRATKWEISLQDVFQKNSVQKSSEQENSEQKNGTTTGNALLVSTENGSYSTATPLPDFTRFNEAAYKSFAALTEGGTSGTAGEIGTSGGSGIPAEPTAGSPEEWIAQAGKDLKDSLAVYNAQVQGNTMSLAGSTSSSPDNQDTTTSDYQYRGIYTQIDGQQIRLFDYTDDLLGTEQAIQVDRLGNQITEYIYKSSDGLYLKSQLGNTARTTVTDSIANYQLDDILHENDVPTAPNFFNERFAETGEINFNFRPANTKTDNIFRLSFYDYIDRYTRLMADERLTQIEPLTRKTVVDLIPDLTNETMVDSSKTGLILKKPFATYTRWLGNAYRTGPDYRYLHAGDKIRVAANRSIYTDAAGAKIRYVLSDVSTATAQDYNIPQSDELQFLQTMDIEVLSGKVILVEPNTSETPRSFDLGDLRGLPILPETNIDIDLPTARLDLGYYNGATLEMNGSTQYQVYDLGSVSQDYSVSIPHENGWFYSQLENITPLEHTSTRITLLSPQLQADREAPLFNLSKPLRVPIYQQDYRIDLSDMVSDNSAITDLYVDTDLTKDTDADSVVDNDRDTETSTGILRKGSKPLELYARSQTVPMERKIKFWVTDEMGNVSSQESKIIFYSPVPEITSQSGATINGILGETLQDEPIDLMRFRNGAIERIGETTKTDADAEFKNTLKAGDGVVLRGSGTTIASINEKTGVITLPAGSNLSFTVEAATAINPMRILLKDGAKVIYTQALALGSAAKIEQANNLDSARKSINSGVGVILSDAYALVKNSSNSVSLPGWAFIVGTDRKPVFGIAQDGNIYPVQSNLKLEYGTEGGVMTIVVRDAGGAVIARCAYLLNAEYIIK